MNSIFTEVGPGITAIDTEYVRPRMDASHLIIDNGHLAFVDTGTNYSVPNLLATLKAKGFSVEAVDFVFLTHIHLDHAGGAGKLMQHLPRATTIVHPRGLKHLATPDKLVEATKAVYGLSRYEALYGELVPIELKRMHIAGDGETITVGRRAFELIHTPGHALHHYCMMDNQNNIGFTGDTFGVSYRETDTSQGAFIMPATTPVHFDPEAAHSSIERIMSYAPEALYLTHYSRVDAVEQLAKDMHRRLDVYVEIARRHAHLEDKFKAIYQDLRDYIFSELNAHGFSGEADTRDSILADDLHINTQGIIVWLDRLAKKSRD